MLRQLQRKAVLLRLVVGMVSLQDPLAQRVEADPGVAESLRALDRLQHAAIGAEGLKVMAQGPRNLRRLEIRDQGFRRRRVLLRGAAELHQGRTAVPRLQEADADQVHCLAGGQGGDRRRPLHHAERIDRRLVVCPGLELLGRSAGGPAGGPGLVDLNPAAEHEDFVAVARTLGNAVERLDALRDLSRLQKDLRPLQESGAALRVGQARLVQEAGGLLEGFGKLGVGVVLIGGRQQPVDLGGLGRIEIQRRAQDGPAGRIPLALGEASAQKVGPFALAPFGKSPIPRLLQVSSGQEVKGLLVAAPDLIGLARRRCPEDERCRGDHLAAGLRLTAQLLGLLLGCGVVALVKGTEDHFRVQFGSGWRSGDQHQVAGHHASQRSEAGQPDQGGPPTMRPRPAQGSFRGVQQPGETTARRRLVGRNFFLLKILGRHRRPLGPRPAHDSFQPAPPARKRPPGGVSSAETSSFSRS